MTEESEGRAAERGVRGVVPHLVCRGAAEAIAFYVRAFGAEETMRLPGPDGRVVHAGLVVNGSLVMLGEEAPEMGALSPAALGGSPVTIHLDVDDADAWVARAEAAGAAVEVPVADMFWGDRYGVVRDPFGHRWSIGHPVRTMTADEIERAMATATPAEAGAPTGAPARASTGPGSDGHGLADRGRDEPSAETKS